MTIPQLKDKVMGLLIDYPKIKTLDIAKKCKIKPWKVRKIIKEFRIEGTGIHPCSSGYVLSEFATKQDDVELLRRINGRRTSDLITLVAAKPHIIGRWKSIEEKRDIRRVLEPILGPRRTLEQGKKLLLGYEKKYRKFDFKN